MNSLYPFLMQPAFDPRPWGTTNLAPIYPNHKFSEKIGESWLTGDACKVSNGPLANRTLSDLSQEFGPALVGSAGREATRFPLLLKFLFPEEKLSVQVHPDDERARIVGEPWGKTECWYVAYAKPGAQIGLGLKAGITTSDLERAIRENRAEETLNWVKVFTGDMIYVAGGTVHTLGPGSVIVETQQQSDTTYRLYDYGRPRELHLKDGLAAVKVNVASGKVVRAAPVEEGGNRIERLIGAPYFVVERYEARKPLELATLDDSGKDSVQILVAVEGCAIVESPGAESVTLAKGDAVVVPASVGAFQVKPQWSVEFLRARVPGKTLPEPETRM